MVNRDFSSGPRRTALVGVLSASSLAFLCLASVAPSGRLGLDGVAGLFPMAAVLAAGRGAGWLCWAVSGVLGLILVPDKGVALLYLAFFGLYPVIKSRCETKNGQMLSWLIKLVYFNAVLCVFWFFLRELFLPSVPAWLEQTWLIFLLGNIVFVLYDIGLSRLICSLLGRFHHSGGRP
jgi:hypothetical protein